jgi:hypothetical protein
MSCLNLPPHLRHKPGNEFVFGLIPLPHEPKKEEINQFLRPVIDVLVTAWQDGTFLSRTPEQRMGLLVRSALAMLIVNMQGRKVSGFAHPSSRLHPCPYCCIKQADINNTDYERFECKEDHQARAAGQQWRDTLTQAIRDALHSNLGSRYTEFLRLVYWNVVECVVIDGAHCLLLGLLQHHSRQYLGFTAEDQKQAPLEKDIKKGRAVLSTSPTKTKVGKLPVEVLRILCKENGLDIHDAEGARVIKKMLVAKLLVGLGATLPTCC